MLRFILLAILIILVVRVVGRLVGTVIDSARGMPAQRGSAGRAVKLVRDPVCGTYVAPDAALSVTARGGRHYFCSEECRRQFGGRQ